MRRRTLGLVLALALVAPAHGWASPTSPRAGRCRLAEDRAGDTGREHIDLRYVDVALTKTHFTITFGVTDVGDPVENGYWRTYFRVDRESYRVTAYRDLSLLRFEMWGGHPATLTGTVDDGVHEVRVAVPLKAFRTPLRKGSVLTDVWIFTGEEYGVAWYQTVRVDGDDIWLDSDARHVLGRTGC